jgi:CHASE2 domain-containing sensor protein
VAAPFISRPNRRARWLSREVLRVALLLVLIAVAANLSGLLVRLDHLIFDVGQRLNWRAVPNDVVIVAVDKESLDRLGRWPWPRDQHARLLHKLCADKPAVIGFDIAFSEKSDDPVADALLAEAMAACGNVVLPLVIEFSSVGGQLLESPPIRELFSSAAGIGRIGVRLDGDGVARSVDLREGVGEAAWPLLASELLRVASKLPPEAGNRQSTGRQPASSPLILRQATRRFSYFGPPQTVPHISYASIVAADLPPGTVTGRIVLVGATAVGLGDALMTPVSSLGQPMSGVEVQANLVLSMRDGRMIGDLPLPAVLSLTVLLAMVPLLWLPRLMPLAGLLASVAWVLLFSVVCGVLPGLTQTWFAPSGALVAGVLAFPLWSWRRLEAVRRHFDEELRQLQAIFPDRRSGTASVSEIGGLSFEQRIAWVHAAKKAMRDLETQRNEALTFISHDLRAPLASVVCQLENEKDCDPQRLLPPLRRALAMAQAFLWLARAEALDRRRMKEIELVGLLEQALDEVHLLAEHKPSELVRCLPDEPVWICGDFESIERCAINLLHNALEYAPPSTPVSIGLDAPRDDSVRFWVENDGPPLSAEQIERLFQQFSSGVGEARTASSMGLGLYFVRTVADRHGGQAGVECSAGKIRFWVSLPAVEAGQPEHLQNGPHRRRQREAGSGSFLS